MENKFSQIVGGFYALTCFIPSLFMFLTEPEDSIYGLLPIYLASSCFLSGYLISDALNVHPKNFSKVRIILSGIISGIIAHPICWFLFIQEANFDYYINKLEEANSISLKNAILTSFDYSLYSLVAVGWITIPLAIAAGFIAKKRIKNQSNI